MMMGVDQSPFIKFFSEFSSKNARIPAEKDLY